MYLRSGIKRYKQYTHDWVRFPNGIKKRLFRKKKKYKTYVLYYFNASGISKTRAYFIVDSDLLTFQQQVWETIFQLSVSSCFWQNKNRIISRLLTSGCLFVENTHIYYGVCKNPLTNTENLLFTLKKKTISSKQ